MHPVVLGVLIATAVIALFYLATRCHSIGNILTFCT